MRFLKLTFLAEQGTVPEHVWVNMDNVLSMRRNHEGELSWTAIYFGVLQGSAEGFDETCEQVTETPEQIMEMLRG